MPPLNEGDMLYMPTTFPNISIEEATMLGISPDGPRYKAIGNSMAVPVMRWIGRRIDAVEQILRRAA